MTARKGKAVEKYRLDHLPTPNEVAAIGEKWRPNRSLASFYLWASGRAARRG